MGISKNRGQHWAHSGGGCAAAGEEGEQGSPGDGVEVLGVKPPGLPTGLELAEEGEGSEQPGEQ